MSQPSSPAAPRTHSARSLAPIDSSFTPLAREIKSLYLTRFYKKCTARAQTLLSERNTLLHPTQRAYLLFYAGLSLDTHARTLPRSSPSISAFLDRAEDFYAQAERALPAPLRGAAAFSLYWIDEDAEQEQPEHHSEPATHSEPANHSETAGRSRASTPSKASAAADDEPDPPSTPARKLRAIPNSHARQLTSESVHAPSPEPVVADAFSPRAPDTPPATPTPKATKRRSRYPAGGAGMDLSALAPAQRYNAHLNAFAGMLAGHVAGVRGMRREVEGGEGRGMSFEERLERIRRGREEGWRLERFDPRQSRAVCLRALAEL
ncbi:hypothetical protein EJ06DRAFT_429545 [Trichodelitschia bisporula]|uniref:Uncharacterized protein n=1 Tax=Trichodelitschia bisporula TaxID=703511 RepID=A0A6G1HX52_9PEZI|nr:hypothetical protein EJ06DRAFT_429545 [Trichodelitschia bisporula]